MLDDLREHASSSSFIEEEVDIFEQKPRRKRHFLGMTPLQRFVIAAMLLLIVLILSSFCLLVSEKVVLPFV